VLHILEETLLAPLVVLVCTIFDTVTSESIVLLEDFCGMFFFSREPG
jgi:hypothetical protein